MATVTANLVESKLRQWQSGELTAAEVHNWAEDTFATDQWEPESDAVNEVLAKLDTLDMDLVTAEDVPVLLSALRSNAFEAILAEHFARVDIELRRVRLAGVPPYAPFCRSSA